MAGLRDRSQRLLVDGCESSFFVADRGIVVDRPAKLGDVFLPPADLLQQFLPDFRRASTPEQQMFAAVDFRRLGQDCRPAVSDQHVAGDAERRVAGDSAAAVAAAAIGTENDFRNRDRFAADLIHLREHVFQEVGRVANGLRDPPCSCMLSTSGRGGSGSPGIRN